ncbi:MAG TPA: hypothetical protein DCL44_10265 [Elusimicrobia bacterium]|nr:hypothetical protein [Elusimicrobiota bacterium]
MNLVDPENFRRASTFIHVSQGAALLVLGAVEAYTIDNKAKRTHFLPPAAFLVASALMLCSVFYFLGGWKLQTVRDALELRAGFYVFTAFAWFFTAAGLSRLMALYMGEKGGLWQFLFLGFLCVIGLLYFSVPYRVNETAWDPVFAAHTAMGFTLIAATIMKVFNFFIKIKALNVIWAILILTTAGQLLFYREDPRAFEYHSVTLQSSPAPQVPAAKDTAPKTTLNAKPADKKRPSH